MNEEPPTSKPKPRIESLSDLIFGLALSIGALTLIGQQPITFQQLLVSLGFYGFSFLILISVWRVYSTIMSVLPVETSRLIDLNILLLFIVSIEPYLFNQLLNFSFNSEMWNNVSLVYSLDLAAMFLILAFFSHYLTDKEKKLVPENILKRYKFGRNLELLIAMIFVISAAPFFWSTIAIHIAIGNEQYNIPLRVIVWVVTLPLGRTRTLWERTEKIYAKTGTKN